MESRQIIEQNFIHQTIYIVGGEPNMLYIHQACSINIVYGEPPKFIPKNFI